MTGEEMELLLRREWWLNHRCSPRAIYGDDGEMQCGLCLTDFKRLPMDELQQVVNKRRNDYLRKLITTPIPAETAEDHEAKQVAWRKLLEADEQDEYQEESA